MVNERSEQSYADEKLRHRRVLPLTNMKQTWKSSPTECLKSTIFNVLIFFKVFLYIIEYVWWISKQFKVSYSLKNKINRWRPESSLVSKYAISRNGFGDLHLLGEGRFLDDDPTHPTPARSPHTPSIKLKLASLNRS